MSDTRTFVFNGYLYAAADARAQFYTVAGATTGDVIASGFTLKSECLILITDVPAAAVGGRIELYLNGSADSPLIAEAVDAAVSDKATADDLRGPGADEVTITWTNSSTGLPVADGDVWISTDAAGDNVVAGSLTTNAAGQAMFLLTAGLTYYLWAEKVGVNSINGQSFTAVADA